MGYQVEGTMFYYWKNSIKFQIFELFFIREGKNSRRTEGLACCNFVKCQISYTFYCHCMSKISVGLWNILPLWKSGKCTLAFLKLQPWVRGGQGYSKTKDGDFDLITRQRSSYNPVPNLRNFQIQNNVIIKKGKCGMTKT